MQWHILRQKWDYDTQHEPKSRIWCVVEISIFGFEKYCQTVFNLTDIKISPTFKQLLQAKIINTKKNKAYYPQYYVKIIIALHKEAVIKQHIYEKILARKTGVYYSPIICFKKSLVDMDKSKALPKRNQQQKRGRSGAGAAEYEDYDGSVWGGWVLILGWVLGCIGVDWDGSSLYCMVLFDTFALV